MVASPCLIHDGQEADTHGSDREDVTVSTSITVGVLAPISGGFYYGGVLSGITREVAAIGGRVVFLQTTDAGGPTRRTVARPTSPHPQHGTASTASSRSLRRPAWTT